LPVPATLNTFVLILVPEAFGIKREVRCKSGAIPVAVSSIHNCPICIPLSNQRWEGIEQRASQKTCQTHSIIHGFRVKSMECKYAALAVNLYFNFISFFPKAHSFHPGSGQQESENYRHPENYCLE
jgi:hypothetical protein